MKKNYILFIAIGIIAIIGIGLFLLNANSNSANSSKYKTQAIDRGEIVQSVSASGTLNPVTLVQVGTQVSGTINKLYVDFNSNVVPGQKLAEIDPILLKAQLLQSEGALDSARANVILTKATLERTKKLKEQNFVAQADADSAQAAYDSAVAQVKIAQGRVANDKANVDYATITSPVVGTIVSRNIDIGQTVAASFQTPTLFTVALDLKKMQIIATISEADIGVLHNDQKVEFTVDAYRDRQFIGVVTQIRLNATIIQNVVNYNVVIDVNNDDGALLPGMTAFVNVIVAKKTNILRIPNTALQFRPLQVEATEQKEPNQKGVYIEKGGKLHLIKIKTGITGDKFTELLSGDLKEGDNVVVEEILTKAKSSSLSALRTPRF